MKKRFIDDLKAFEIKLFPVFVILATKMENFDATNRSEYRTKELLSTQTKIKRIDRKFYKPISKY